ncbi:hypothetical protein Tco_0172641 [Tanacetum coccineum]
MEQDVQRGSTDPAGIESMQEDLLQFKRLDAWVLVPALDNIKTFHVEIVIQKTSIDEENTVNPAKSCLVVREAASDMSNDGGIEFFLGLQVNQSPWHRYKPVTSCSEIRKNMQWTLGDPVGIANESTSGDSLQEYFLVEAQFLGENVDLGLRNTVNGAMALSFNRFHNYCDSK